MKCHDVINTQIVRAAPKLRTQRTITNDMSFDGKFLAHALHRVQQQIHRLLGNQRTHKTNPQRVVGRRCLGPCLRFEHRLQVGPVRLQVQRLVAAECPPNVLLRGLRVLQAVLVRSERVLLLLLRDLAERLALAKRTWSTSRPRPR